MSKHVIYSQKLQTSQMIRTGHSAPVEYTMARSHHFLKESLSETSHSVVNYRIITHYFTTSGRLLVWKFTEVFIL
uniref:Uncharacterized protein n=1 Tax=Anguilla anguilla TaxID=7936 RepID=A0A0E9QHZ3_ANGAN